MAVPISVIIPMYNARRSIWETLEGLAQQERQDFEVLVVDDGSTDGSAELVEEFASQRRLRLRCLRQENTGPARARNRGAREAEGDTIIFLDSDCVPPPNWLEEMVRPLDGQVVGCSCGYRVRNFESWVARYVDYEIAWRRQRMRGRDVDALVSNAVALNKEVFLSVGGFNEGYRMAASEDFDLSHELVNRGYRLRSVERTFVYHYHPDSLKRYLRQQFYRGYWRVRIYWRHRDKILTGDDYSGVEAQVGFVTAHLALLSLPLAILFPWAPLVGWGVLFLAHLPLGLYASRRERGFLLLAPAVASLRSMAGTWGAWYYVFSGIWRWMRHRLGASPLEEKAAE